MSSHLARGVDIHHYISVFTMKTGLVSSVTPSWNKYLNYPIALLHHHTLYKDYFLMPIRNREAKSRGST